MRQRAFMAGGKSILVPQFSPRSSPVAEVGAAEPAGRRPSCNDALAKDPSLAKSDLSCLPPASPAPTRCATGQGALRGAGRRARRQGQAARGHGLTEAVTAIMAMPLSE